MIPYEDQKIQELADMMHKHHCVNCVNPQKYSECKYFSETWENPNSEKRYYYEKAEEVLQIVDLQTAIKLSKIM